jgi:hypothetical protein
MKASKESRDTSLLIINPGARYSRVVNITTQPLHPRGRTPAPTEQDPIASKDVLEKRYYGSSNIHPSCYTDYAIPDHYIKHRNNPVVSTVSIVNIST